jgi:hypothetical protein
VVYCCCCLALWSASDSAMAGTPCMQVNTAAPQSPNCACSVHVPCEC